MTLRSRSREANTRSRRRRLREEKRHSKSTCSSRESDGLHSSITCRGGPGTMDHKHKRYTGGHFHQRLTSVPEPGRKFLTVMVLPGAGKGASIIPLIKGCTRAGEMALLFSTSSKIFKTERRVSRSPSAAPASHSLIFFPRAKRWMGDYCYIQFKCIKTLL